MEYTYLKTKVKVIAMSELIALQNAYIEAEKNNQEWLMQSMAKAVSYTHLRAHET